MKRITLKSEVNISNFWYAEIYKATHFSGSLRY